MLDLEVNMFGLIFHIVVVIICTSIGSGKGRAWEGFFYGLLLNLLGLLIVLMLKDKKSNSTRANTRGNNLSDKTQSTPLFYATYEEKINESKVSFVNTLFNLFTVISLILWYRLIIIDEPFFEALFMGNYDGLGAIPATITVMGVFLFPFQINRLFSGKEYRKKLREYWGLEYYCTNCGRKLSSFQQCSKCGAKILSPGSSELENS